MLIYCVVFIVNGIRLSNRFIDVVVVELKLSSKRLFCYLCLERSDIFCLFRLTKSIFLGLMLDVSEGAPSGDFDCLLTGCYDGVV